MIKKRKYYDTKQISLIFSQQSNKVPNDIPCKICEKPVAQNHKAICCDVCDTWVHILASWSCIECSKDVFPFSKLNETNFLTTIAGKKLKFITTRKKHNTQEEIFFLILQLCSI